MGNVRNGPQEPHAICTLHPITSRADLLDYHRFRYCIYANSQQRGFLAGPQGFDTDVYDSRALHLGWYENDRLVGCVRLLDPIAGRDPLHFFKDLPDGPRREAALALVAQARKEGLPVCEVSRLCLAPEKRSLATVRRFVLAVIATAHRYGRDHCLFTCDAPHAAFWQRMGFEVVEGFSGYDRPRSPHQGYLLRGNYATLLALHRGELQELGHLLAA